VSEPGRDERILGLARGLAPVRPIPRLRTALAAALALWLLALVVEWSLGGAGVRGGDVWRELAFLLTLAGLVGLALGALGRTLAAAVPGRERAARGCGWLAALGLALAALGGIAAIGGNGWNLGADELRAYRDCASRSLQLGSASSLAAMLFASRAVLRSVLRALLWAAAGGAALGASWVHSTCSDDAPLHSLLAHVSLPLIAAGLIALAVAALIAPWRAVRDARRV